MNNHDEKNGDMWVYGAAGILIVALLWYTWITYGHVITNKSIELTLFIISLNSSFHNILPDIKILKELAFFIIPEEFLNNRTEIENIIKYINPFKPSWADLKLTWTLLGHIFRIPLIIYTILLTWKIFRTTRPLRMKRKFDIFSLARLNIPNSPHIRHAIQGEIHKSPYNEGPHRQEEGCIRFAILLGAVNYVDEDGVEMKVRLGDVHKIDCKKNIFYIEDSFDEDEGLPLIHGRCTFDIPLIKREFRSQITNLGVWKGFGDLPRHAKALSAVFLYLIKGGKENNEKAYALLRKYNFSYKKQTKNKSWDIDDSEVDSIIEKFCTINAVKNITQTHYYNVTLLVALYFKATSLKTKLPPSVFYWLKEVDRGLWYALHQNLSPASWCEAAGVRSIELVEAEIKIPCSFPYIDAAMKGLFSYLDDEGWPITKADLQSEIKV